MIIISQDEEKIVNFDNVESIGMIEFASYICIKAKMQDAYIDLGSYKDLERAKEVLKEISTHYSCSDIKSANFEVLLSNIEARKIGVFYMPKE